jgi:hypothetical protein
MACAGDPPGEEIEQIEDSLFGPVYVLDDQDTGESWRVLESLGERRDGGNM